MRTIFFLPVIILISLLPMAGSGQTTILTSGFESWNGNMPNGWGGSKTSLEADSIAQYTTSVHGGTYAVKLTNMEAGHKRFSTTTQTITDQTTYTVTFWVRGHGDIRAGMFSGKLATGTYGYSYSSYIQVNSTSWVQQTQTLIGDTTNANGEFLFSVRNTKADIDHIQIDDVNITSNTVQSTSIYSIQYTANVSGDSPYNNMGVTTSGIVTAQYTSGYFIQNGAGPWNGVYVYDNVHIPVVGDNVTITGVVMEYYNLTEIKSISSYVVNSSGNTLPQPAVVTAASVVSEQYEGVLVKITNARCVNIGAGSWSVNDGTGSCTIASLLYTYTPTLNSYYDITGILYYTMSEYRIEPRSISDIVPLTGPVTNQDTVTVMHYNLLNYGNNYGDCNNTNNDINNKDAYLTTIVNYVRPDLLDVNEMRRETTYHQQLLDNVLNTGGITYYSKVEVSNTTYSSIMNMLYYNSQKFGYLSQQTVTTIFRDINIVKLFYKSPNLATTHDTTYLVYVLAHLKADDTSATCCESDRADMIQDLMTWLDTHYDNSQNYIIAGDMNLKGASEQAFQYLTNWSNATVRFYDPVNQAGEWYSNSYYAQYHTQSTHTAPNCFAGGGLDDRFDLILASANINNGTGRISYLAGSYETTGQDGLHYNTDLTANTNASVPANVLNALYLMSDHLPVVLKMTVDLPVSSPGTSAGQQDITVYINNPVSDRLHLKVTTHQETQLTIEIVSVLGNSLQSKVAYCHETVSMDLPVQQLTGGVYILKVTDSNGNSVTRKFIKL